MRWAWPLVVVAACATPAPELVPGLQSPSPGRRKSELVLRCQPPDAEVVLDGVSQGTCEDFKGEPRGLSLGNGSRRVEVRRGGYQGWESWMVADGTRMTMDVTLIPNGGSAR